MDKEKKELIMDDYIYFIDTTDNKLKRKYNNDRIEEVDKQTEINVLLVEISGLRQQLATLLIYMQDHIK